MLFMESETTSSAGSLGRIETCGERSGCESCGGCRGFTSVNWAPQTFSCFTSESWWHLVRRRIYSHPG